MAAATAALSADSGTSTSARLAGNRVVTKVSTMAKKTSGVASSLSTSTKTSATCPSQAARGPASAPVTPPASVARSS